MTPAITLTPSTSLADSKSDLERAADAAFATAEAAEIGLAIAPDGSNIAERLSTGSFYTPSDVVAHFWREYEGFHHLTSLAAWRSHLERWHFVEPSAGAGVFLFGLISHLASQGADGADLRNLNFTAVDINQAALHFVENRLRRFCTETGIDLDGVRLHRGDFLAFTPPSNGHLSFIGNPPYVRNTAGARWRNLYADFIERMLETPARSRALSLIVPLSISFSRDYGTLRRRMNRMAGLRIEAFDNIPDCLFSAGKPGHGNTNKANSQRCVILSLRDQGPRLREATELRRWSRRDRAIELAGSPQYWDFDGYEFNGQWPRPSASWTVRYFSDAFGAVLGDLCGPGDYALGVAGVARNYIGLRSLGELDDPGVTRLNFPNEAAFATAFQILASPLFYEGWRTLGDGFHVTRSDILDFPISPMVESFARQDISRALEIWRARATFEKVKLNAGREVRSFDFRGQFDGLVEAAKVGSLEKRAAA